MHLFPHVGRKKKLFGLFIHISQKENRGHLGEPGVQISSTISQELPIERLFQGVYGCCSGPRALAMTLGEADWTLLHRHLWDAVAPSHWPTGEIPISFQLVVNINL